MLPRLAASESPKDLPPGGLVLWEGEEGLSIAFTGPKAPNPIRIAFGEGTLSYRWAQGGGESLVRAVRGRRKGPLKVLDATAGFGVDAFVLASHGMDVTMMEREPNLCLLLEDGLQRGLRLPSLGEVMGRLRLQQGDSLILLRGTLPGQFDVVSLDPMFPERKGAALPSKEMQALRQLVGAAPLPEEEAEFLECARKVASRVVVKRPKRAPPFGGMEPRSQRLGRSCRFDIYGG